MPMRQASRMGHLDVMQAGIGACWGLRLRQEIEPMTPPTTASGIAAKRCHLLSNGSYRVLLDASGSGYSRWRDVAVTRWREDPTTDPWGSYLFLSDEESGRTWSVARQPLGTPMPDDDVEFAPGSARFVRRHHSVHSVLEVAVDAGQPVELRRLSVSNHGDHTRRLSLTSYAELVLGPAAADDAHPAFSKMFVQTEWDAAHAMLLATRRRRDSHEPSLWLAQALQVLGRPVDDGCGYETDRARWLGRGRTLRNAQALLPGTQLGGTVGCVLDPVFSLRQHFTLAPRETVTLLLWTRVGDSREKALALAGELGDGGSAARLIAAAGQQAVDRRQRYAVDAPAQQGFGRWLGALVGNDASQRAAAADRQRGHGGAPTLWAAGISGDRPLLLLRLRDAVALDQCRELLRAQRWWQEQYFAVDVVLLGAADDADGDALDAALKPLLDEQQAALKAHSGQPKAEVFALREDRIGTGLRDGLLAFARVVLDTAASAAHPAPTSAGVPPVSVAPIRATRPAAAAMPEPGQLEFPNGLGGFVDAGRSYRIELKNGSTTPAPWINVIANPAFGFLVSAEGAGYTWSLNSQQNALTPWPNDAVSDTPHEALYLRDEDTGVLWSATALPIRLAGTDYVATHGKGWTRFSHITHELAVELTQCVPTGDSVKLSRLRLVNRSARTRRLRITAYVEWMLGANGTVPAPFVITACDAATGALLARNPWRPDFADRVAFMDLGGMQQSISGDRTELLGAFGSMAQPAALHGRRPLAGALGAGLDPCGALQTVIELPPHTEIEVPFLLGDAADAAQAQALVAKYRERDFDTVLGEVAAQWSGVLDAVQVHTPDRALDIMLNDWLLYQVTSCRLWARTAGYQASGAYGFRDQLQDVMALCVSRPDLAREHLLRAAGRQFAAGDVQHWWLPPKGQGIRTRISDDRIWLAYVASHYLTVTGDAAVLDERVAFLTGQPIAEGATDAFFQPGQGAAVSIYEHCALALDSSLALGAHDLPLIGTGDWNDGYNNVGAEGRGESVWLGWFLCAAIAAFAPLARQRGDDARAQRWLEHAAALRVALEQTWDGQWYRRGYYDDGAPLGSSASQECWIDTIAQSWSTLGGAPPAPHAAAAMAAVDRLLVDHANRISRLFTPPFDHAKENPGYIKGYPPGVRENGGQYTHGAIWSVFAWAQLGDGVRTADTFDILNPIHHSDSVAAMQRYKVEPYVACADVYAVAPHIGRGGWTWYTGSAAWLYRAGLEALLGFQLRGDRLHIEPCIPPAWPGFSITWRRGAGEQPTSYLIVVENPDGVCRGIKRLELDGQALTAGYVPLADDGAVHRVHVVLG
jgi:cyclic beta-1,2-glucan synthetase